MGQRHQLFVIAKINGRYRGLAAIHHQCLWGASALQVCLNILKILQSPANRIALSHELRHATRLKEEDWARRIGFAKVSVADIPFPLFLHVWLSELASEQRIVIMLESTIFLSIYHFMEAITTTELRDEEEDGAPPKPPAMTPLTGPQYLWGYYRRDYQSNQEKFQDLVESFQALPLIDGKALYSAWPNSSWRIMVQGGGESEWNRVEQVVAEEKVSGQKKSNFVNSEISSLKAFSLVKVLNSAIASSPSELPQILERASLLWDFYPAAKAKLYADPADVSNFASARRILRSILRNENKIDLSPFELTTEQISEVLEEAFKDPMDVVSLNLSGNLNITEPFLKGILIKFPRLETLYLLNTPQISLENKIGLLRGSTIQLYDTELLALPFVEKDDGMTHEFKTFEPRLIPLYGYIKPVIHQMIIMACCSTELVPRDTDGGLNIESMFEKGILLDAFGRDHSCIPFGEVNLKPSALITGIGQYVHYVMNQQRYLDIGMMNPPALNIAKQLAMPHTFEDNENSFGVGTISEYFYHTPNDNWSLSHIGGWWKKYSKIAPGEWTLVLIGETDRWDGPKEECAKVRYAFVSAAPPTDTEDPTLDSYVPKFIIRDFRGFLDSIISDVSDQQQILEI
ncbi:uncharacterized protein EAF01_008236 [Botrytis porri]|uniref:Uncharacterized protein n=1 Tax=Botrytis porri TaxID=87229 RepID=A0A4Z1L6T3_9HELO|nr:uncharacterized protein EAF01_008236 [Botrytis porri]KAF7899023.1 hypothetical protein EAF01_008236 [Botrytis porri]TGO92542.1 hypothetical protein BPOR_0001g00270 [Botrytis porri]